MSSQFYICKAAELVLVTCAVRVRFLTRSNVIDRTVHYKEFIIFKQLILISVFNWLMFVIKTSFFLQFVLPVADVSFLVLKPNIFVINLCYLNVSNQFLIV